MTKMIGRPAGYADSVPLKILIREDIPYRSDGVGISPGYYEANWTADGWPLNVLMPRFDHPDAMAEGSVHVFISRTDIAQVVAKYVFSPSQWVETAAGEFNLDKPVGIRRWLHTPSGVEVEKRAVDATTEAQGVVADYANVQKPAIQQQLADIAQSAANADAATARLEAALADMGTSTNINGNLRAWTASTAYQVTHVITRHPSTGAVQNADIQWPDGVSGVFTALNFNPAAGAFDSFEITHIQSGKIVSQPPVARDISGNIITQPTLVITGGAP